MPVPLSSQIIQRAPKVLLHDHLDGGLRPSTIVDLAAEVGYTGLPTMDVADLQAQIRLGADRKDLALYLETFAYTTGVMQHRDALARRIGRMRSIDAPVVPTKLARMPPSASIPVLTSGVPDSEPCT